MRKLILAAFLPLAFSACNTSGSQQLISDIGAIAGAAAQVECARINPAKIPAGVATCQTIAGDLITIAQAQAQGLIAKGK